MEIKLLFIPHYDYLIKRFSSPTIPPEALRELAPEARIGMIYGIGVKEDPFVAAQQLDASSIHLHQKLATRAFLDKAWEAGLDVHVWTVNELHDMEKFASLGVQGIVSDYPERFWRLKP
jgi:glycerophosphoryl diester phosphodiesterase